MTTHEWAALGTYAQLVVDDDHAAPAALQIAKRLVAEVDATCSRFRPESDLMRASDRAGEWVRVDPLLVSAVESALHAARSTGGLVDPTLGARLVELGYDRDLDLVRAQPAEKAGTRRPSPDATNVAGRGVGRWTELGTDRTGWIKVPAGCTLDLGATGKAFAADLVVRTITEALGCSVVVSLGGDVAAVSMGTHPGWPVLVSDTAGGDLESPGQVVMITNGGLATSSTQHRRWQHDGSQVHHIVDPRTGEPADEVIVTATVRAASCVDANAASTAAIILGDEAAAWLAGLDVQALLVGADGRSTQCNGWPMTTPALAPC